MVIKQPTVSKISILAAGILWSAGQGFLLIPQRMEPVAAALPPGSIFGLGGLCIFASLATLSATFVAMGATGKRALHWSSLILLAVLGLLFLQAGFYPETSLIGAVCIGGLIQVTTSPNTRHDDEPTLTLLVLVLNLITGLLLLGNFTRLPDQPPLRVLAFQPGLAALFLISGLAGILALPGTQNKPRSLSSGWLSIPWLIWIAIFLPGLSFSRILPPLVLGGMLLLGTAIPWNQFTLPEGDRIGNRLALAGALALFMTIGVIGVFLNLLDPSSGTPAAGVPLHLREWTFLAFTLITGLLAYGMTAIAMTIHSLMAPETNAAGVSNTAPVSGSWSERIARYLKPFSLTREGLRARMEAQIDQIDLLSRQLADQRHRAEQFAILSELSQQLEENLDPPVAAQLAVKTLERAIDCSFVCLYIHELENREYVALASAGRKAHRPIPGYRQNNSTGVLGRVTRLRKTQIVADTRRDADFLTMQGEAENSALSYIAVPLTFAGSIRGAIEIESELLHAFSSNDVALAENIATELVRGWERSGYHSRLRDLIQAGISLTTIVEPEATIQEIANIAQQTLAGRFAYISLLFDREENLIQKSHCGKAPRLLHSLENGSGSDSLLRTSVNAVQPFRVRDVRKYLANASIELDDNGLRSMLVTPIRLHGLNIGTILVFGKQKEAFFTENDESLANLLAAQAAAAIESVWLLQELRTALRTTRLLYELSHQIIQAEDLGEAARHIATTAYRLFGARLVGIVLFRTNGRIATRLEVDSEGVRTGHQHPMDAIQEVMDTGRTIYQSIDQEVSRICLPIQTPARKHGVLWLTIPEKRGYKSGSPADLQTLTNQAALALERAILMVESRQQAQEIEGAFHELELAYDRTLLGLISTLDARDRETEGHSTRVSLLTVQLGTALGLDARQLKALERGALLHDIGKIGISDSVLHKPGPLSETEWRQMRLHPRIGARIIEGIPFLEDSLPVILCHHERWDGSGYPEGLKGTEIPQLARIFSVVDAFDALTSDRPYRRRISALDALATIRSQSGSLFDPEIVAQFEQLLAEPSVQAVILDRKA